MQISSKFSFEGYGSIPEYEHTARTIEEAMSLLGKDIIIILATANLNFIVKKIIMLSYNH